MSTNTKIEWAHHSWSPWWGCTEVSPACDHCYARELAKRFGWSEKAAPESRKFPIWGKDTLRRGMSDEHWRQPEKWNAAAMRDGVRYRVFPSMCDPFEWIDYVQIIRGDFWSLIDDTPHLDWLLLTKRPQNVMRLIPEQWREKLPHNVWIGATVENQQYADIRIPELRKIPASVRFLSCEPLLGPVDLTNLSVGAEQWNCLDPIEAADAEPGAANGVVHWVICGGESGPKARPMHPQWARSLRDQCRSAGVPFHFKQWGEWSPVGREDDRDYYVCAADGWHGDRAESEQHVLKDHAGEISCPALQRMYLVRRNTAGRILDGRTWDQFPEVTRG